MAPVEALIDNPEGSVGAMLYVKLPVPPEPLTGLKLAEGWFSVRDFDATACVAVTPVLTARINVLVAVAPLVSVTVTVKVDGAVETTGIPEMVPVDELIANPAGRSGDTEYCKLPVPPDPVTGVKGVAAKFTVRPIEAIACVAVTAELIARLNVLVAVAELASVTVTVYVVAVEVTVGVPEMAPVVEFNDRPVGNVGETLNDNGVVPPPPVTGVNEAAWLCVRVVTAIACVAVTVGLTVSMNVLLAVAELVSVTVTVYVVATDVTDGFPETVPVDELNDRPVGNDGEIPGLAPPCLRR